MKVAFHDASGRPLERHVLLERQYGTHGFDCKAVNGTYGADLRQRYRDGLMSEDEKSALQEMNFNFTYYENELAKAEFRRTHTEEECADLGLRSVINTNKALFTEEAFTCRQRPSHNSHTIPAPSRRRILQQTLEQGFSVPHDGTLENEEDDRLSVGNIHHEALGSITCRT